jgi:lipopolysaccharide export system protein LptA
MALAALLAAGASHALSTDREQPIHIEADQAVLDDQAGVAEYEGSVVLTQGSIRILAERLTVYMDADDALERAVAVGAPARFRQLPDDAEEYVRASARTLDYRAGESLLELTREARIVQGGDLFSGDHITYDTGTARVQARRAEDGDERVRVTFTPKKDGADADSE